MRVIKMDWIERINKVLRKHKNVLLNPERRTMIDEAVKAREAMVAANGALACWTPTESTGRSPKDTVIVRRPESEDTIDWDSPNNIPIDETTFDMAMEDALKFLSAGPRLFVTNRSLGSDPSYCLHVRTVSDHALVALFTDNMFRPLLPQCMESVLTDRPFTLVVVPFAKLDPERYKGRLRKLAHSPASDMIVAMDFDRRLAVIVGSSYGGSVKKTMFTVMNYMLPAEGVLPLHCSATEGPEGDCALYLGLSGTGKTTLSADPRRALLGDDEHGWSDNGVANFEYGCYAKFIDISREKEPEIYNAVMHEDDYLNHGAIVENAMIYPNGHFDFNDDRYTPNSRASYPLRYLTNIKKSSMSGHPKTILFLTADANGVLPPISKLTPEQAMLWFLMGYTSKLAGTETGIIEPVSTFSRFFGQPFMPRNPDVYYSMLGQRMKQHGSKVFLVNTGWAGAPYGAGDRMDIDWTRAIVQAALTGALDKVDYTQDPIFNVWIPKRCPGVPWEILNPRQEWTHKSAYEERARELAHDFHVHFKKTYADKVDEKIARECPE